MKGFLYFLGKRRPADLSDQHTYAETVSRPKAEPVKHDNPRTVAGHQLSEPGRHRARRR